MKNPNCPLARRFAIPLLSLLLSQPLLAIPLRILAWDDDVAAMRLAVADSKGSTLLDSLHPSKRTKAFQVVTGEKPTVIEALDRKNPEGKPFTTAIKIPEGTKQPLLVILPDAKATTGIRTVVFEDDTANFAWGATRFINATGKELVFVQEKKALVIPPTWTPVMASPGGALRNMEVKLFYKDQPNRAIYSAIWEHNPDQRTLIFLVPGEDPRLGPVAMKMIPEDRRTIAAPPVAG
jgi:hypothetical protein